MFAFGSFARGCDESRKTARAMVRSMWCSASWLKDALHHRTSPIWTRPATAVETP